MADLLFILGNVLVAVSQVATLFLLLVICRGSTGRHYHSSLLRVPCCRKPNTIAKYKCVCTLAIRACVNLTFMCSVYSVVTVILSMSTNIGGYLCLSMPLFPLAIIYFYGRKLRKVEA